jgi:hypothetical protein
VDRKPWLVISSRAGGGHRSPAYATLSTDGIGRLASPSAGFRGFPPLRSMGSDAIGGANGGSAGARTQDQYLKRVLLYQLSYRPVRWRGGRDNTLAPARCTHRLLSATAPRGGSATVSRGGCFGRVTRLRRKESR